MLLLREEVVLLWGRLWEGGPGARGGGGEVHQFGGGGGKLPLHQPFAPM